MAESETKEMPGCANPHHQAGAARSERPFVRSNMQIVKSLCARLGLDVQTLLRMMKAALAPTLVVAVYQSDAVSNVTTTFGYVSALMSVASQCLLPRAKFMKIMFYMLLSVCLSASISCLAIFCSFKARRGDTATYNSSACAVSAIFLLFSIWLSNSLRAYRPMELQDPMVAFSIFAGITLTHSGQFATLAEGLVFVKTLLCAFMIGFAIPTGVSLLILPITNRRNMFAGLRVYSSATEAVLISFKEYIDVLQTNLSQSSAAGASSSNGDGPESSKSTNEHSVDINVAAAKVGSALQRLHGLHDRIHGDLVYATREVAWGKLSADDLESIFSHLRGILLPVAGLSMSTEILEKFAKGRALFENQSNGLDVIENTVSELDDGERLSRAHVTSCYLSTLEQDTNTVMELVNAGLRHSMIILGLSPNAGESLTPEPGNDLESKGDLLCPGRRHFSGQLKARIDSFYDRHNDMTGLPDRHPYQQPESKLPEVSRNRASRQNFFNEELLVALSLDNFHDTLLGGVSALVDHAESKSVDGKLPKSRLILPKSSLLKDWLSFGSLRPSKQTKQQDAGDTDDDLDARAEEGPGPGHFETQADPEHLSPTNTWQWLGDKLRSLSNMMASQQSVFGFRVACASFTVGILAYLRQTQDFYITQRLIWAMIVIVIGMSPNSGASIFGFVGRVAATVVALVLSFICWYIVDGQTAGVIVFLFLGNMFLYYFYQKYMQFFGPVVISIVTFNIILAYELQVRKLGIPRAISSGQPYYPIYLFGPYKLACVAAGCLISFFWIIFPYPISTRSQVRKMLGHSIFTLAKFYGYMHSTIEAWMTDEYDSIEKVHTPARALEETRNKLFVGQMALLAGLRKNIGLTRYEPAIGGKFPTAVYNRIIGEIQSINFGMAIMAYLTKDYNLRWASVDEQCRGHMRGEWISKVALLTGSTDFNSHKVTSLLCQLSSAVSSGTPVPPYLAVPEPFPLARSLRKLNREILDVGNARDPAFRAFASMEVMSSQVNFSLKSLSRDVTSLVGEMSFGPGKSGRKIS